MTHEELCCGIVEGAGDAIIFADRQGQIRLWNGGAESLFGFAASEAIGRSLDLIIPERLRDRHWEGFREAMRRGTSRYGSELLAVPALRKDGTRISLEFTIVLLRSAGGEVAGTAAVIRDVTARFEEERQRTKRLAALEARVAELTAAGRR